MRIFLRYRTLKMDYFFSFVIHTVVHYIIIDLSLLGIDLILLAKIVIFNRYMFSYSNN